MTELKMKALAMYLECEIEEIEQTKYNENEFETPEGDFLVYIDEEADEEHTQYIQNLWDDIGLESFTESAQEYIIQNFGESDWLDEAMRESYQFYIDDIREEIEDEDEEGNEITRLQTEMEEERTETEEDFLNHLCEQWENGVEWYKSNFGENEFSEMAKKYMDFDIEAIAEYCRDNDGRGHSLASYDGEENEITIEDEVFYIYRTN